MHERWYLKGYASSKPNITHHLQAIKLNDARNWLETTLEVTELKMKRKKEKLNSTMIEDNAQNLL